MIGEEDDKRDEDEAENSEENETAEPSVEAPSEADGNEAPLDGTSDAGDGSEEPVAAEDAADEQETPAPDAGDETGGQGEEEEAPEPPGAVDAPSPTGEEQRTVFQPPAQNASPPPAPSQEQRTVFQPPSDGTPPPAASSDEQRTFFQAPASQPTPPVSGEEQRTVFQAPAEPEPPVKIDTNEPTARRIQVGDVLNHIFEVTRFIARGGMGEVFEGINVNTEERVAIKVILPHLAADPAVQAMFLKEARTLTKLNHSGLVQYRVLAQEPKLRALYIVTDYVDGTNLSDCLSQVDKSPNAVRGLLRRLAMALQNAHDLGAIHRDISPDNIMLEGGALAGAKIIDFGIAKDLDPGGQTVVGDGFAGKLGYVAPEQLGDFNRNVGPWTDIYSLALTMLALLRGQDVDMGATLVEAVDRRREGVDLSDVEDDGLRSVLTAMLRPDPTERPQSMNAVIDLLGPPSGETSFSAGATGYAPAGSVGAPPEAGASGKGIGQFLAGNPAVAIGGGLALLALVVLAFLFIPSGDGSSDGTLAGEDGMPTGPVDPPDNPLEAAQAAVGQEFRTLPCSWLDIENVTADGTDISLQLRGVSGKSAEALDRIEKSLARIGLRAASIDFSDVSPIQANTCRPLEAFLDIRSEGVQRLDASQRKFEMNILPASAGEDAGKLGGQAVITVDLADLAENVTLIGIDETGEMTQFAPDKQVIVENAEAMGADSYRFTLNTTHSGWSGILMLIGQAPFPESLLTSSSANRPSDWPETFAKMAAAQGWKSEMVWYRTVDEVANAR